LIVGKLSTIFQELKCEIMTLVHKKG